MITMNTATVTQLLAEMSQANERSADLQRQLVEHARQQEIAEKKYDELVVLAAQGMELLCSLRFGDIIDAGWEERGKALSRRVQPYLDPH